MTHVTYVNFYNLLRQWIERICQVLCYMFYKNIECNPIRSSQLLYNWSSEKLGIFARSHSHKWLSLGPRSL